MNVREVLLVGVLGVTLGACLPQAGNYPDYTVRTDAGLPHSAVDGATALADSGASSPADGGAPMDVSQARGDASSPPLPQGSWENVTANFVGMNPGCGNLQTIAAHPDTDLVIAGLSDSSLWSFNPATTTWSRMNTGAGADMFTGRPSSVLFDPKDPAHFWATTIYGENGVYQTKDGGKTFQSAGAVKHIDAVSVNFGASDYLPWVAGGHEVGQTVWLSTDSGATWTSVGGDLPASKSCTQPLVIDTDTFLIGCSYNATGIYRSTDQGKSWQAVSDFGGTGSVLRHPSGALLWADSAGSVFISNNKGQTWSQAGAPNVLAAIALSLVLLPDGRVAALGKNAVIVSSDLGATWAIVSPDVPYGDTTGFTYSAKQGAFFIKHDTCMDPVPDDAVMRYEWKFDSQ